MNSGDLNTIMNLVAKMNVSGDSHSSGDETQVGTSEGMKENVPTIHKFTSSLGGGAGAIIFYQLSKLGSSSFLWIGEEVDAKLNDLSLSSPTLYARNNGEPKSVKIFGSYGSTESTSIAGKLAKKLNKPFYVSFNLQDCDLPTLEQIDSRIFDELNVHPEKF